MPLQPGFLRDIIKTSDIIKKIVDVTDILKSSAGIHTSLS